MTLKSKKLSEEHKRKISLAHRAKVKPLEQRLAQKIIKGDKTQCWLWQGRLSGPARMRYGYLWHEGKSQRAHRLMWESVYGTIPNGLCVLHKCDVPLCLNPDHLFLGTKAENNADRDRKGRQISISRPGEKHHNAKLTDSMVREIRKSLAPVQMIAKQFKVSASAIWNVRRGISWTHVSP